MWWVNIDCPLCNSNGYRGCEFCNGMGDGCPDCRCSECNGSGSVLVPGGDFSS